MYERELYPPIVHRMPSDYRWATAYEAETWNEQPDAIQVVVGGTSIVEGYMTDIAVPAALPLSCVREFGPHDEHDDECENILFRMHGRPWDDGFADAYNRDLEAEMLGRPLFPNEY